MEFAFSSSGCPVPGYYKEVSKTLGNEKGEQNARDGSGGHIDPADVQDGMVEVGQLQA